ncbi:hypothetical protein BGX26_005124 [Mortierella sp. AD094]|nr:hypothetical protein BGX26_005124 [Mortierella sp. AD094]
MKVRKASYENIQKKPKSPTSLIPEIISSIFSHLDQKCLRFTVSLVCREWNALAHPHISRTVCWTSLHPSGTEQRAAMMDRLDSAQTLSCERGSGHNSMMYNQPFSNTEHGRLKELIALLQSMSSKHQRTVKTLVLSIGTATPIWTSSMSLLETLGASLTSLRIHNLPEATVFPWRLVFRTCPGLLHLDLQTHSRYRDPQLEDPQNGIVSNIKSSGANDTNANTDTQDLKMSLKTFTLHGFSLTKDAFYPFARACPKLRELRLIKLKASASMFGGPESGMFFIQQDQVAFLHKLPELFPMLRSLHLSTNYDSAKIQWNEIPSQFLHNIESWGLGVEEMLNSTSSLLKHFNAEGFLTSLELIGDTHILATRDYSDAFMPFGPSAIVGDLLHAFLCQAPNLLHLKAEGVNVELNLLHPFSPSSVNARHIRNNVFLEGNSRRIHPIWACRNLKTLHLRFDMRARNDNKTDENSRKLFGYISRVCPRLEDLLIHREELTLGARSGFCLLSNLDRLKRLKLITAHEAGKLSDDDVDWIRNENPDYLQHEGRAGVQVGKHNTFNSTELRVEALIQDENQRIEDEEKKFWDLQALHKKHGIPMNQGDIPASLRGVPLDELEGGSYTKKRSLTGLFSKMGGNLFGNSKREAATKESAVAVGPRYSRFMVDGVDMQYWGEDSDLMEYFKKRRAQRDVPIWPEMERLEIKDSGLSFIRLRELSDRLKNCRSDIEFF